MQELQLSLEFGGDESTTLYITGVLILQCALSLSTFPSCRYKRSKTKHNGARTKEDVDLRVDVSRAGGQMMVSSPFISSHTCETSKHMYNNSEEADTGNEC